MTNSETETTHYKGCFDSGPNHYQCALNEITKRRFEIRVKNQVIKEALKLLQKLIDNDFTIRDQELAHNLIKRESK